MNKNIKVTPDELHNLLKCIMDQMQIKDPHEAIRRIHSGEWLVSLSNREWRKQDGIIYFSVTSDGTTGSKWIERFESNGFYLGDTVKNMLCSPDFRPTSGITTQIAVVGENFVRNNIYGPREIRHEAKRHNFEAPNAEVACLIREKFSDEHIEAMGFSRSICVMHRNIIGSSYNPCLFSVGCIDRNVRQLHYSHGNDLEWDSRKGCAFAVSNIAVSAE